MLCAAEHLAFLRNPARPRPLPLPSTRAGLEGKEIPPCPGRGNRQRGPGFPKQPEEPWEVG